MTEIYLAGLAILLVGLALIHFLVGFERGRFAGGGRAARPFLLEAETRVQFHEVRSFQVEEIAKAFSVPPRLLEVQGSATLRLLEEGDLEALKPTVRAFAMALHDLARVGRPLGQSLSGNRTWWSDGWHFNSASWTGRGWGAPGTGLLDRIIWMAPLTFALVRHHGFRPHQAAHYARSLWEAHPSLPSLSRLRPDMASGRYSNRGRCQDRNAGLCGHLAAQAR
jgi:hypothetical protein